MRLGHITEEKSLSASGLLMVALDYISGCKHFRVLYHFQSYGPLY